MTLINLLSPIYINVKQYGAVGDGSTDDTASIQAAINTSAVGQYYSLGPSLAFAGNNASGQTTSAVNLTANAQTFKWNGITLL